ncbi:MAG: hypothetical protein J0I44_02710, partial [Microbacterium sp.]|nr:hypothetical protein [Microbacterium sp.]
AYAIAATVSGFVPLLTLVLGQSTGYAWWHPGIILAVLSAVTLVAAVTAARRRAEPESGQEPETDADRDSAPAV